MDIELDQHGGPSNRDEPATEQTANVSMSSRSASSYSQNHDQQATTMRLTHIRQLARLSTSRTTNVVTQNYVPEVTSSHHLQHCINSESTNIHKDQDNNIEQESNQENWRRNRVNTVRRIRRAIVNYNCGRDWHEGYGVPVLRLPSLRTCPYCNAWLFHHETSNMCCLNGKIVLPLIPSPPEMMQLFSDQTDVGRKFRQNIRAYNNVFAFTSMGVHVDESLNAQSRGIYTFRAQETRIAHVHMLVMLDEHDKLNNPEDYDHIVRAEIPNKDEEPQLYDLVLKHMIHGPCGLLNQQSSCMKNGECKKNFPKNFTNHTVQGNDAYPIYRRRASRLPVPLCRRGDTMVDNRWVVPYNPWLLLRYDCHVNVEVCGSIKSVKYLYKYVYKGLDKVAMQVQSDLDNDEIRQFVDARWVCAPEALWKIFKFVTTRIYPSVERLQIHLPDMQCIRFDATETIEDILANEHSQRTMLTEFFNKNHNDSEARRHLYREFPQYYRWDSKYKKWEKRRNNIKVIGRIYSVSPFEGEKFFLRVLLNHVRGPKSFRDLLTVNRVLQQTFKEAAEKRATAIRMPSALRGLFVTILVYSQPTGVRRLWDEFHPFMAEDYSNSRGMDDSSVKNRLLQHLNRMLEQFDKSIRDFDLPEMTAEQEDGLRVPSCIEDEHSINVPQEDIDAIGRLNNDQMMAFNTILDAVVRRESALFFVDGPGGTGKTNSIRWKIMIFGGYFRQVLPVVPKGTRSQLIEASIVKSAFWAQVRILRLRQNMRSINDPQFAEFLLRVGDGSEHVIDDEMIRLPECMVIPRESEQSINKIIDDVFPNLSNHVNDARYMVDRALITPLNDDVDMLNEKIIRMFPGEEITIYSFDSVEDDTRNLYQPEFLNSINAGGLPPHKLTLKTGAPIMLLRNIDPKLGLCNGTRLLCRGSYQNLIDAEILTGQFAGTRVFLPRIPLKSQETAALPFQLTRKQFPLKLSFSLTINKSQGQTIPQVGVYLPDHVFSHGQLYVALSRGVSKSTTKIMVKKGSDVGEEGVFTKNVIFKEVLLHSNANDMSSS
ncbi:PREDICTED: uncharacterized protein LOC101294118 [Fragaria vesca subsp. vesca]